MLFHIAAGAVGGFLVGYLVKAFGASVTLNSIEVELTKAEATISPSIKDLIAKIRQHL